MPRYVAYQVQLVEVIDYYLPDEVTPAIAAQALSVASSDFFLMSRALAHREADARTCRPA